ncbi:hypothetical protein L6164_006549 [Bauhinia variegata]|uniref:Uncharacterized protein n=1 Tax=Bauhinia variegata TaxID=167791 RepID=A0ACB9PUN1_BAUVA|nr:hypothetical protein L6164_006549 [Bauhinia variegata]
MVYHLQGSHHSQRLRDPRWHGPRALLQLKGASSHDCPGKLYCIMGVVNNASKRDTWGLICYDENCNVSPLFNQFTEQYSPSFIYSGCMYSHFQGVKAKTSKFESGSCPNTRFKSLLFLYYLQQKEKKRSMIIAINWKFVN